MKDIEPLNLQDPVLDENGFIDLQYYYMKADSLRAEYLRDMFETLGNKIKQVISGLTTLLTCPKCLLSH